MTEAMHVLVFETDHGGHRLAAVRKIVESIVDIDHVPAVRIHVATTREACASDEYRIHLQPVSQHFSVIEVPGFERGSGALSIALAKARSIQGLVNRPVGHGESSGARFSHVYIPYADGLVQMLGLLRLNPLFRLPGDTVLEALMMRGGFAYPESSRLVALATLLAMRLSGCARIHLIDPLPFNHVVRHAPALARICRLSPDPTPLFAQLPRATSRQALGLPVQGRLLGCIGRIDERKGMDLLIRAFLSAPLADDDRLLLVGSHSEGIRRLLGEADTSRIISIDRYVEDDELGAATSALDLMVTPYPDFVGSASIVLRAAAAGRLCLGANTGWMGHVIERYGLGRTCDVRDVAAMSALLPDLLTAAADYTPGSQVRALLDFFAPDNISAHWSALLRERLGVPASTRPREWPAALAGADPESAIAPAGF